LELPINIHEGQAGFKYINTGISLSNEKILDEVKKLLLGQNLPEIFNIFFHFLIPNLINLRN